MAAVKQTLATFMANFFGKSEKAVSEKLSSEEFNQFTTEALGLQEKVTGLETERDTLQASVTNLTTERDTLATQKATLEGEKTTLQGQVTSLETDRDKYKAWFEKQAGAGAQLPETDATNTSGQPELTSYNAEALAYFRKNKGH
ncbi:uncharacterized protein (DUF3084 family) [Spirosoma lacussanchae]|uniref:hypothetical protein n=1 Tax=Spirosoma lacussanchae TaxID=1884249 RepID=UPI001107EABD|nr:hypothetical protein [Spirosoma lacussanchae]